MQVLRKVGEGREIEIASAATASVLTEEEIAVAFVPGSMTLVAVKRSSGRGGSTGPRFRPPG